MRLPIQDEVQYVAAEVAGFEENTEPTMTIHGIYFAQDTSNEDAENWNFTCVFWDDERVCTVKEPQVVTAYGGIVECSLSRSSFTCEFDDKTQKETRVRRLNITFEIDDGAWQKLAEQALIVFKGESYFRLEI